MGLAQRARTEDAAMRGEFRLLAPQTIGHVAAAAHGWRPDAPRRRMPSCFSQSPMNFATATEKIA